MSTDPMAEIRAVFFGECEELLEGLQDALTAMEEGRGDAEAINVVFRAVHSIKGGAGAFGFDALGGFAHRLETVLDRFRAGEVEATGEALKLLFQAADLLQDHVRAARGAEDGPPGADAVLAALEARMGLAASEAGPEIEFTPSGLALSFDDDGGPTVEEAGAAAEAHGPRWWSVRFTPRAGLYTSGNEALLVLRALSALGRATVFCDIPEDLGIEDDAVEQPRLSWRVALEADADRAEIEEVFDFVADVCTVEISEGDAANPTQIPAPAACAAPPLVRSAPFRLVAGAEARPVGNADSREPATTRIPLAGAPLPEAGSTIRVDLQKIDRLANLVGELVINQAMLAQSIGLAAMGDARIAAGLEAFLTLTRDLQDGVMSMRAQPVKPLFQRMARIVREASASLGKEVRLKTEGEATEVDKTVIERLAEPLTHMIRNAVDHALETPGVRLAAGKPPEGQITLSAAHRGDRILIEVTDDGAGIDRAKVLSIARSRGLLAANAAPTEAEIDGLLFLPGFSTIDRVSPLSGRGVGMDVVRSAVAALGGRISIASEPGRGSTFSISLPLTLAVLDGMVVRAAGQTFVIPLSAIVETAALTTAAIKRIGADSELLHIRGELIPLVDLGARLGFRHAGEMNRNGIVLVTAQDDGARTALVVDAIMEQRQVVMKGLGPGIGRMPGVAGATILGDGRIALILDPADLVRTGAAAPDIALAG